MVQQDQYPFTSTQAPVITATVPTNQNTAAHIPPHARSALAPLTESGARHLRQAILNRFKR